MDSDKQELNKKYVLWTYSDYGWHPKGFDSIKEALQEQRYSSDFFITSGNLDYEVTLTE